MGRFRDRMDEDLRIRGYSANTRERYLRCVHHFVGHFMRPPDQLTPEHICQYQLYLTRDRHVSWPHFNQIVCALRFFYREVLKKDWAITHIPYQRTGRPLPEILIPQEVAALFQATPNLKHRALLMTMYAGGLRVSEVTHLRVTDIDSQRMVIRIEQGKGRNDRYVMLSPHLRLVLQEYWRARRPQTLPRLRCPAPRLVGVTTAALHSGYPGTRHPAGPAGPRRKARKHASDRLRPTTWGGRAVQPLLLRFRCQRLGEEPPEPAGRPRGPRQAHLDGFDLHANVWVPPHDRARLEHLCRYLLRPPLVQDRLRLRGDGRVIVKLKGAWRDGTTHLVFEPLEFLAKLAALTPRPEINRLLYHGVLAPHARGRSQVVGYGRVPLEAAAGDSAEARRVPPPPPRNWTWATLLRRACALDVLACPRCGGRLRVIATVEDPVAVRQVLAARPPAETLGPGPPAPAGAPAIAD